MSAPDFDALAGLIEDLRRAAAASARGGRATDGKQVALKALHAEARVLPLLLLAMAAQLDRPGLLSAVTEAAVKSGAVPCGDAGKFHDIAARALFPVVAR